MFSEILFTTVCPLKDLQRFVVGDYKKLPNEVGGMETALPAEVADKMKALLTEYNGKEEKTFEAVSYTHLDVYKRQQYIFL